MAKIKDYYDHGDKYTEDAKRKVVEDIARFGSEARRINNFQEETQQALATATVEEQAAGGADQATLDLMAEEAAMRTGNFAEDAAAANERNQDSRQRLRGAHKRYLDAIRAARPAHKREMLKYRDEQYALAEQAAAGRGGGGGGGGRGGGGGSAKKASASSANIMDPAEKMRQDGASEAQIAAAGETLMSDAELAKNIDAAYAAAYEGGAPLSEVMGQMDAWLAEQGVSRRDINNYIAVYGSKWGTAFDERDGTQGQYAPAYTPQDQTPTLEDFMSGDVQGGSGGGSTSPSPQYGPEQSPNDPRSPNYQQGLTVNDFWGQKSVGSGTLGETYYPNGVFYRGEAYTYDEWSKMRASLSDQHGKSGSSGFGFF